MSFDSSILKPNFLTIIVTANLLGSRVMIELVPRALRYFQMWMQFVSRLSKGVLTKFDWSSSVATTMLRLIGLNSTSKYLSLLVS